MNSDPQAKIKFKGIKLGGEAEVRSFLLELQTDSDPFSFAFGGVHPGNLHAHGNMRPVHKVSYSVGVAGDYLFHVRLRGKAAALPGSPFSLRVEPGLPYAQSTSLPPGYLLSEVGSPCELTLRPSDKMGNECQTGGGAVECSCDNDAVEATCVDVGDGSYTVSWTSGQVGEFQGSVTVGGEHVINSPVQIIFTSCTPVIENSVVTGIGSYAEVGVQTVVGEKQSRRVRLLDKGNNQGTPHDEFKDRVVLGLGLPERGGKGSKANSSSGLVSSAPYEGGWSEEEENVFEFTFVPSTTTISEVHLWCTHSGEPERYPFPGSPFPITVSADKNMVVTEKIDASGVRPHDYRIDLSVFDDAQKKWGPCTIDAFASKATKVLSRFWADTPCDGVDGFLGVDALAHPWVQGERIWAHPPVELLDIVCQKLKQPDRTAETIVCAPQHRSKRWYMELVSQSDEQLKFRKGQLERISEDAPARLDEWPITLFHIPAKEPMMKLAMPPTRRPGALPVAPPPPLPDAPPVAPVPADPDEPFVRDAMETLSSEQRRSVLADGKWGSLSFAEKKAKLLKLQLLVNISDASKASPPPPPPQAQPPAPEQLTLQQMLQQELAASEQPQKQLQPKREKKQPMQPKHASKLRLLTPSSSLRSAGSLATTSLGTNGSS